MDDLLEGFFNRYKDLTYKTHSRLFGNQTFDHSASPINSAYYGFRQDSSRIFLGSFSISGTGTGVGDVTRLFGADYRFEDNEGNIEVVRDIEFLYRANKGRFIHTNSSLQVENYVMNEVYLFAYSADVFDSVNFKFDGILVEVREPLLKSAPPAGKNYFDF